MIWAQCYKTFGRPLKEALKSFFTRLFPEFFWFIFLFKKQLVI